MSNEIMTVGSIRTTVNPSSGIYEALLEKTERERDEAREQNEEQARLLAMSADREEKLRMELQQARDCFSAAMELAERYKTERDATP